MLRGQIWLYNANPTLGDELSKIRPAIIVNNDEIGTLRLKVIVPITGWNEAFTEVPWIVCISPTLRTNSPNFQPPTPFIFDRFHNSA